MSKQQKAARVERAAEAGHPEGIINPVHIISNAGVSVNPPSNVLKQRDYVEWCRQRKRYLLAQASMYQQRDGL